MTLNKCDLRLEKDRVIVIKEINLRATGLEAITLERVGDIERNGGLGKYKRDAESKNDENSLHCFLRIGKR